MRNTLKFIDLWGVTNTVTDLRLIEGRIFRRRAWMDADSSTKDLCFYFRACVDDKDNPPYFAYCNAYGEFKLKSGYGYSSKHTYSTVGNSVLRSTDLFEVLKKGKEMTETINLSGVSVVVSDCKDNVEKTDLETRKKWLAVWYDADGAEVGRSLYDRKRDVKTDLKKHFDRTVVLYKRAKILSIDLPVNEMKA